MERRAFEIDLGSEPWALARPVVEGLHAAGYAAVFVGGCVRDLLFGRPLKDLDLATDARPEEVEGLFEQCVTVGRQFGVTVVLVPGGEIEVASFRNDEAYIDGRRPSGVRAATEVEDVQRRDFTINALIADPLVGELRDHVGGLADVEARVLRVVGDPHARLEEDRLRVLRGLRFAAHLELAIDPPTWDALLATELTGLSRERIWDEWTKGLGHPRRSAWVALVREARLGADLCPLIEGVEEGAVAEILAALERLPAAAATDAAIGLILQPTPAHELDSWIRSQPISRQRMRRVLWASRWGHPAAWIDLDVATRRERLLDPEAELLSDLVPAWSTAWPDGPALLAEGSGLRAAPPVPLLDGRDLQQLGCPPGPAMGELLRALRAAQLAGDVDDRAAAIAFARARLPG